MVSQTTKFPRSPAEGSDEHSRALERLDAAARREGDMRSEAETASGTPAESNAASALADATDQLAAREAWVKWIERGY